MESHMVLTGKIALTAAIASVAVFAIVAALSGPLHIIWWTP